jgi:hypothetical protein
MRGRTLNAAIITAAGQAGRQHLLPDPSNTTQGLIIRCPAIALLLVVNHWPV